MKTNRSRKEQMTKRSQAFTLIELMVVVAIIAILATLSVANFSTAIRRTRNTQRVNDLKTVSDALEECYDTMNGRYVMGGDYSTGIGKNSFTNIERSDSTSEITASGPFAVENNACLNTDVTPRVAGYPYYWIVLDQAGSSAANTTGYVLCAQLEPVSGWESVGNVTKLDNIERNESQQNYSWKTGDPCVAVESDEGGENAGTCYYCVFNNQ